FVSRVVIPLRAVMHAPAAALLETAPGLVASLGTAVHHRAFGQMKQVLKAVHRLDDDGVESLIEGVHRAFQRDGAREAADRRRRRLLGCSYPRPTQPQSAD